MAEKEVKGVLNLNIDNRNEHLQSNKGKYNGYKKPLGLIVGKQYDLYTTPLNTEQHSDILRYTFGLDNEYSRSIAKSYEYNVKNLKYYVHNNIKPSYKVNNYDGFDDYISYIWDTYGREESYAGHLMGLLGVREMAQDIAYDVVPDFRGKTAMDVINEIMQYTDTKYALKADSVGVVRNIDVAMAINGAITTNINNYTGKETKLGLITNRMYASTLLTAANFNSMRRTQYITPDLDKLYGNNLNNVYNLSSLFRVNDDTGRIGEPDSGYYITDMPSGNVFDYMLERIPDFKLPENGYDWSTHPNYGVDNKYYGVNESSEYEEYIVPDYNEWTIKSDDKQIGRNAPDSFRVYSEGPEKGQGGWALNGQETFREFAASAIDELEYDGLLNKTNKFLSERRARTIISRFHDKDNTENNLTQSAVYKNFGVSHGRNLLTKGAYENGQATSYPSGYSNPYCRVWTNHHQYSKMKHLIRPFTNDENFATAEDLQKNWYIFRTEDAGKRLANHGVLNKNGMVNITPTSRGDVVDIKNCMFSIENLAWKDVITSEKGKYRYNKRVAKNENGENRNVYDWEIDNENVLSEEQRGPNGGRIMWFPPYDITFQETASAKWSENEFIGRGEPVYTYVNSSRSGTLEFTLLVDHPSILNYWMMDKKDNATDADEQTLLRFFAGCETIDPSEDVIENILMGGYTGKTIDPQEVNKEKDITFYTFFPNNYSGVDYHDDPETAMKYLFGGYNSYRPMASVCGEENDGTPRIEILDDKAKFVEAQGGSVSFSFKLRNIDDGMLPICTKSDPDNIIDDFKIHFTDKLIVVKVSSNIIKDTKIATLVLDLPADSGVQIKPVELKIAKRGAETTELPDDFHGMDDEIEASAICSQEFFLGYEMGVNPISVSDFSYVENERDDVWFLDKIYTLQDAENKFETLSGFTESKTIGINDIKNCDFKNYEHYINTIYEGSKTTIDADNRISEKEDEKKKLNEEISKIQKDINDLGEKMTSYLKAEGEDSVYFSMKYEKEQLESKIEGLKTSLTNIEANIKYINTVQDGVNAYIGELSGIVESIELFFESSVGEFNKTNPLYLYYDYQGEETLKKGSGVIACGSAAEAFAKYSVDNAKTYFTSETPYDFLKENEKVICRTKSGKDNSAEKYWICSSTEGNLEFPVFSSKRKFMKSGFAFGMSSEDGVDKYYINHGGEIYVFKNDKESTAEEKAVYFIQENKIVPEFSSKQEFDESGELYGYNPENSDYYSYKFDEVSKESAEQQITTKLNDEGDNDYIVKKYYENHKFGCLSDFGYGKNYGVVQFYFTGKMQETGEMYETIQDFIASHDIQKESPNLGDDKSVRHTSFGVSKYISKEMTDASAEVRGIIEWDLDIPIWNYPVDEDKMDEKLASKNYYDTQSFGLNSTYEIVKKEMGDADVTFSFGEVYAALHGEKERDYVIACERAMLKKVLKLEGAELEEKVKEAQDRIDYLVLALNPKEGTTDLKISSVETLGTASSHGYQNKNKGLSDNREQSIQKFLKAFPLFKNVDVGSKTFDADGKASNAIIQVSNENPDDVSDISAKKGRCSRVSIVIGNKDLTEAEIKANNEQVEKDKEEMMVKRKHRRYDNERLFFEMLKENDNIAYKRLVDKVKYFSPAFHSITPEGFNARLTFLHQCTRQGPTATASDVDTGTTAANLAFGRAPYCVLRLGDFLNTKIVITSVNITYPDSLWDLNPEGIGVQFMMAKVSMQIHILGGSDISAPIKRLQNAVSFNYYANTSLYDNRSDVAEYNDNSKTIEPIREWFPHMEGGKS